MAKKKNILTQGKKSKADQLAQMGQLVEAQALYASVCKTDPMDVEAWVKQSVTQRRLGQHVDAESCARRAIMLAPDLSFAHHALGAALQCLGKLEEALAYYRKAIQLRPDYADTHYLLGNALLQEGRLQEAADSLRCTLELQPHHFEALSDLGAALMMLGRIGESADFLHHALALKPDSAEVLANLANFMERDERLEDALALYQRALRVSPDAIEVIAKHAELLEKAGRMAQAREQIEANLPRAPLHPMLNLVAARLERREERHHEAAALLEAVLNQPMRKNTLGDIHLLLGQLYDRLGDTQHVLTHLTEGKRLTALAAYTDAAGPQRFLDMIDTAKGWLDDSLAYAGQRDSGEPPCDTPVFLLGFPRSGTTLLEQILDSHPALQTLEEKPTVAAMRHTFEDMARQGTTLANLDAAQVACLRQTYLDEVDRHIERRAGTLLVDKLPLNTVWVPLIWRVFPEARFILAIRHPCDVVLSCLMQSFTANEAMAGFATLADVTKIYTQVMGAWQQYSTGLPLHWHRIRYEDLVADMTGETRALLSFLGLDWDDAVLSHTQHARQRGIINTPSYHQVSQPIYQHARYRWKRYEHAFMPLMGALKPYIDLFDYHE